MAAWLNGEPAGDDATCEIAGMMAAARTPLIAVDAVDLAAAAAAIDLAQLIGARLDHTHISGIAPLQEQGSMGTTPGEAYSRADTVLLIGPLPDTAETNEALTRLINPRPDRQLIRICENSDQTRLGANQVFAPDELVLHDTLGLLKARVSGNPVSVSKELGAQADTLVEQLKAAKYGVAVISPSLIDDLSQFAIMALVDTLSKDTRWTLLACCTPAGQSELLRMSLASTGLPSPIKFTAGRASHDPWLHGAANVTQRDETDLAVWVSSSRNTPPAWLANAKNTIIISADQNAVRGARAQIEIGVAGIDHPAILENTLLGTFTNVTPTTPSTKPSAASVLNKIAAHIAPHNKEAAS